MTYGYEDGSKGVEASYWIADDTLYVKIAGANHWRDYLNCFLAWPRFNVAWGKVHRKWFHMAISLSVDIRFKTYKKDFNSVHIAGHSMGGAVGTLLGMCFMCKKVTVVTVNSPKVTNARGRKAINESIDVYNEYDTGDIVRFLPVFYRRTTTGYAYASTFPFWNAHNNFPVWWWGFEEPKYSQQIPEEELPY